MVWMLYGCCMIMMLFFLISDIELCCFNDNFVNSLWKYLRLMVISVILVNELFGFDMCCDSVMFSILVCKCDMNGLLM